MTGVQTCALPIYAADKISCRPDFCLLVYPAYLDGENFQLLKRQNIIPYGDDGLTTMQKHVLKFILLETLHREIYQKDVEEEFQIRKSTATGILQLMEKNGFIYRESSEKDARLKTIVPTKKAEALRAEILENIRVMEKRLTKGISEEEFSMCMYVLWKMFDNLAQTETQQAEKKEENENNE